MSDSSALPKCCPKCGETLPTEATEGLCPNCLMGEAMEPTLVSDASKPKHSTILSPEELAPLFPQYEILRMLGRGGMGAVYLARQISLNRLVAIKILPADLGESDMGFAERFKNEAQAMAQLSHACIVAVFDFGQTTNGLLYIVMEYIEGTDVQLMLANQGRLHSAHAMAITAHVCDALQYAHSRGIIHRDIKPSNIMVSNDGVVKVADFGLAKMSHAQTTGLTQSGMAMGTLHFMAPEALTLGSAVDQRADIYAVGVMLYQMLTGKLPQGMFEMPSFQVPGLDPRYDRIVAKALRDDREVRYQAAVDLRHDLDAILTQPVEKVAPEAEEVKALPPVEARGRKKARVPSLPPPQTSQPPPAKKKPVGLILTVLAAVAALAAAFVYFHDHGTGPTTTEPALATKDQPFVNSLGMKFVPVPITGGPTGGQRVLFSVWETRVQDYEAFVEASHREPFLPVFPQDGNHPAVLISCEDAGAFCAWLTEEERKLGKIGPLDSYRLPTDHEWSCAVGIAQVENPSALPMEKAAKSSIYPWGKDFPIPHGAGNFFGEETRRNPWNKVLPMPGYDDGFDRTSPVGSFRSNQYGLHDLEGNVREACLDLALPENKELQVVRGGSWGDDKEFNLRSSIRYRTVPSERRENHGFRCVLDVGNGTGVAVSTPHSSTTGTPQPASNAGVSSSQNPPISAATPATATKDAPFTNTLGMKFVPVPGADALMCIHETRRKDYARYSADSPGEDGSWMDEKAGGFTPTGNLEDHPVMKVSWEDARKFCEWLSQKEGKTYRLPTDQEWSMAAGIGQNEKLQQDTTPATVFKNQTDFPWGTQWPPPKRSGNFSDLTRKAKVPDITTYYLHDYEDGFPTTAPVMSFKPNQIGLYDLSGNVCEWCADWYDTSNKERVLRGGSWNDNDRTYLLSSYRGHSVPDSHIGPHGFRVVLVPPVSPAATEASRREDSSTPTSATKDAPFINTLGMKFVLVPITGGPTDKQRVLFSVWDTRVQDYEAFQKETNREWPKPDFQQGPTHPAVMLSWEDAQAFCQWLTERERKEGRIGAGERYRLPSDHEWSCAAGIGDREDAVRAPGENAGKIKDVFPWDTPWPPPANAGNYAGEELRPALATGNFNSIKDVIAGYNDGFVNTSPVGSFRPNQFGLFDMGGNVYQMCEDWLDSQQKSHPGRGAAWDSSNPLHLQSSYRARTASEKAFPSLGFRCVLAPVTSAPPAPAVHVQAMGSTKDAPFVNTLGMKFVPVPGTKVLFSIWETRVQDYAAYAEGKKLDGSWARQMKSGVPVSREPNDPVVGVNWDDAQAFCQWLSDKEIAEGKLQQGAKYRLPTDEEWSRAAGLPPESGATPEEKHERNQIEFPWGRDFPPKEKADNLADVTFHEKFYNAPDPWETRYTDGYAATAPVGSFVPNLFGIHDLGGNVSEWCQDYHDVSQERRAVRGGAWIHSDSGHLLSSHRTPGGPRDRGAFFGFRCVLEPVPDVASTIPSTTATETTKGTPFVNSLGMKFVSVPGTKVLMCVHETRKQDYAIFATESPDVDGSWQHPVNNNIPFAQAGDHPVVNVSWEDAKVFCEWLGKREGEIYRLPTDREWSIAAGTGDRERQGVPVAELSDANLSPKFLWGNQWPPPKGSGNFADSAWKKMFPAKLSIADYTDGYANTSPVMSFLPNKLGIYDLGGNASEWCEDWFDSQGRVLRGGTFSVADPIGMQASHRSHFPPYMRYSVDGFRCVLEASASVGRKAEKPDVSLPAMDLSKASKDQPFVNSLGMKFVPVPITGGPTNGQRVLFSIWETRVRDYEVFVREKKHEWPSPPYQQQALFPAGNASLEDARAFCAWLTERERKTGRLASTEAYRLPSDHEWSCAVGIGPMEDAALPASQKHLKIPDSYPWGTGYPPPSDAGNYNGEEAVKRTFSTSFKPIPGYDDGHPAAAPVGSFKANPLGLFDMGGNFWEFCEDRTEDGLRVIGRGASYLNSPARELLSSWRSEMSFRAKEWGFRIVLAPAPPTPAAATKDNPFVNTLGMKFIPLPGTKTLMSLHETRNADYAAFATAVPAAGSGWKRAAGADSHPAVNVSWEEAAAFCTWLGKKENRRYRLPTDREWSIAAGLVGLESATLTPQKLTGLLPGVYPWGTQWPVPARAGNYAGSADGFAATAPVMSFAPNALGFYDLGGNVWEFCSDGFNETAQTRVLRGASWSDAEQAALLSSCRDPIDPSARSGFVGFRVVLEEEALNAAASASLPAPATSVQPPANTIRHLRPDKIKYSNKAGGVVDRFAWKGKHAAVLSESGLLDAAMMTRLVGDYDRVYEYYRDITGREPRKPADVGQLAVTAEDDTSSTNWSVGATGTAKIWVKTGSFQSLCKSLAERQEHSVTWFREFGLNTWYYAPQLSPSGSAYMDAFPSGYCIVMRTMAARRLGLKLTPPRGGEPEWDKALSMLLERYLADSSLSFDNTIATNQAPANSSNFGAAELFAAICLRLCEDHGGDAFLTKLWQEVGKAQPAKTAQDCTDAFILAACAAADKDLSTLFTTQWRWPMSSSAMAKATKRWKKP